MAYETRDNSGILFKNDKREKDSHPHAQGTCMIGGVEYYISAWTKEGAKGKFQSLAFKPVRASEAPQPAKQQARPVNKQPPKFEDDNFDDCPF